MKTIIGLTGAYCSGKNTAAHILEKLGWYTIDLDTLGHKALELAREDVIRLLGKEVCSEDGTLERGKIAKRVFPDPELLSAYEALVHPIMFSLLDSSIDHAPLDQVCINAAILYKIPQASRCSKILEIQSPFLLRLMRGLKRDKRSVCEILAKMNAQKKLFVQRPASIPITAIINFGSTQQLERKICNALKQDSIRYHTDS